MAFGTKRVWISSKALDISPAGNSVSTSRASIGTVDIKEQNITIDDIICSTSANANKVTAFNDLLNTEVVAKIDTLIDTTMGVDVTGNTVDYNFNVTEISRGLVDDDIFLAEANNVYVIKGKLTVAIS